MVRCPPGKASKTYDLKQIWKDCFWLRMKILSKLLDKAAVHKQLLVIEIKGSRTKDRVITSSSKAKLIYFEQKSIPLLTSQYLSISSNICPYISFSLNISQYISIYLNISQNNSIYLNMSQYLFIYHNIYIYL